MATSQAQHYVECGCGKPSDYFCNTCPEKLCYSCVAQHLRIESQNGHNITQYAKRKKKPTSCYCELHTEFECHVFCNKCDVPVCFICVSTKHQRHEMVELHEKTAQIKSLITEQTQTLQLHIRPVYRKALTRISSKLLTVPRHFSTVRDKLRHTKVTWHKEVDDVIKKFEEDVDNMETDQMTSLQKQKDMFEERLLEIDKTLQENREIKNSQNSTLLLNLKPNIKKQFNVPPITEFTSACFIPGTIDRDELKNKIGSLDNSKPIDYSQYQIKVEELKDCVDRLLDTPSVIPAIDDTGFTQDKNNNRLTCIVPLSHDRVWVGGHSNDQKLMDLQGRLLDTVPITCLSTFIAYTADGHVIYSDCRDNKIKMISDDNTIQTLISTGEWQPRGSTSTTSGDILACLSKKDKSLSKVVRYNSAGHVMQEIQYDAENQPLYDDPWYITVNKNNDICTTNFKNKTLVVVDESGTFRFNYDGKQKYKKTGLNTLTTDLDGNILICDFQNDVIHMLNMDGRFLRIIAPEGLKVPRGICFVGIGKLCVGESKTGEVKLIKYLKD